MEICSSIDIGSNTIRVLVAEGRGAEIRKLAVKRRITRLGGNFHGELDPESMSRTLDAVREFSRFARDMGAASVRAGCTGVIRKAKNRDAFLSSLRSEAGIEPVLLTGEEEARLAALGARRSLGSDFPEILIADIGGFSTELSISGEVFGRRKSFDLGVVSLTETLLRSDPPAKDEIARTREKVAREIAGFFDEPVPGTLVVISGTPSTIAAIDIEMEVYDSAKLHRHVVGEGALQGILERLLTMTSGQRLGSVKGLEKGREDLIPSGIVILQEIMKAGGYRGFTFSSGSLLDGILMTETWPPKTGGGEADPIALAVKRA